MLVRENHLMFIENPVNNEIFTVPTGILTINSIFHLQHLFFSLEGMAWEILVFLLATLKRK